ncbi:MAG: amidase family protein [Bacteroidales bacterium]|nr:amidase family protein [Bacteroidales bacterium]
MKFGRQFLTFILALCLQVPVFAFNADERIRWLRIQTEIDRQVVDLQNITIPELQDMIRAGKLTYYELTRMYLRRIELYDLNATVISVSDKIHMMLVHIEPDDLSTLKLNSVRMLNRHALSEAKKRDSAFVADPSVAQGLFGMPVLVKNNVNVVGMPNTAGSVALANNYPPFDAPIITKLKDAGAIILGKLNLTEFANFIAIGMTSGFSSLGGQVLNPYRPVRLLGDTITLDPSGSSAGSGVAAAAAFSAVTIGTETSGSILSPAFMNFVVGIKPTVGLISRHGIIPISSTQDIAGPMTRNVTDAAILLTAMAGFDPNDETTESIENAGLTGVDFTQSLRLGNLQGRRLGLIGIPPEDHFAYKPFQQAIRALRGAGAEIVTKSDGSALTFFNPEDSTTNPRFWQSIVLAYDFARDLPAYLATLDKSFPIKTLQDIIDFNNEHMKTNPDAFPFGQELLIRSNEIDLEAKKDSFLIDRERDILLSRTYGIDYLLEKHNLDGLVNTSLNVLPTIIGARARYPTVSIPLANYGGTTNPVNMTFIGTAFSEAQLIEFAFVVEQAGSFRIPPGLAEKTRLGEAIQEARNLLNDAKARIQTVYDFAWAIYQNNFLTQDDVDKAERDLRAAILSVQ